MKKGFDEDYLKDQIEHEKRNLLFYALLYDELVMKLSRKFVEKQIDFHLDRLIIIMRQLKDKTEKG